MKKKLFSMLLTACLCASLVSVTALADEEEVSGEEVSEEEVTEEEASDEEITEEEASDEEITEEETSDEEATEEETSDEEATKEEASEETTDDEFYDAGEVTYSTTVDSDGGSLFVLPDELELVAGTTYVYQPEVIWVPTGSLLSDGTDVSYVIVSVDYDTGALIGKDGYISQYEGDLSDLLVFDFSKDAITMTLGKVPDGYASAYVGLVVEVYSGGAVDFGVVGETAYIDVYITPSDGSAGTDGNGNNGGTTGTTGTTGTAGSGSGSSGSSGTSGTTSPKTDGSSLAMTYVLILGLACMGAAGCVGYRRRRA